MTQIAWTSPVTSRLLLEGSAQLGPYFWWGGTQKNAYDTTTIPVQDQGGIIPGLNYRSSDWSDHTGFTNILQGSASYITGSHSAKFGMRYHANDSTFPKNYYNDSQLHYQFLDGVPQQLTMYADQGSSQQQHQGMFSMYAQDRWTLGRLTLQGGLRFERLVDHFDEQQMGPNRFLPTAVVFPAQDGPLNQKDLQPRFGAAYDVFGNGKTAVKGFLGEYVTTTNTVNEWLSYSPAGIGHFTSNTTRSWIDANHDFAPNCNLLDPVANGECGPMASPTFGKTISPTTVDPDTTSGWNKREHSWDLSLALSQQIAPRVSFEVSYNRRSWGNLQATINRNLTLADFDTFTYKVPTDPKLASSGQTLTYVDLKPAKFGQIDNYLTFANKVGGIDNTYNGVDFSVNARLRDVVVQGGFSTGNVVEDSCGVAKAHPEVNIFQAWGGTLSFFDAFQPGLWQWPVAYCHRESGWQTSVKGLASYTVPKVDVVLSGTFHRLPYPGSNNPSVTSQSLGAQTFVFFADTSLGRFFANGSPVAPLQLVQPGAVYGDRLSGVDLRLGKNLRYGRTRTLVSLDIFNLFNSNAVDVYQQTYGPTYLNPLSITQARFFKIGVQLDF